MKWHTTISSQPVTIESVDGSVWTINGVDHVVELQSRGRSWMLRIGERRFDIQPIEVHPHDTHVVLQVNGKTVELDLESDAERLVRTMASSMASPHAHLFLKAPMPGKIARILVEPGSLVEAGQPVLILEAMKMENELRAPAAGSVRAILVHPQDAVEKNALLLELE